MQQGSLFDSTSLYEEWGYAAVEAMAAGLPVVGFHHQALADIVTPSTGILVAPGDVSALAQAISHLLNSPDVLMRMSKSAKERVRKE